MPSCFFIISSICWFISAAVFFPKLRFIFFIDADFVLMNWGFWKSKSWNTINPLVLSASLKLVFSVLPM